MKKAKLWKVFLIVMSAAVLPFALVAVGQPQHMTCWCIKPSQTGRKRLASDRHKSLDQKTEDVEEHANSASLSAENEGLKNVNTCAS
jgi:hypothetical protein